MPRCRTTKEHSYTWSLDVESTSGQAIGMLSRGQPRGHQKGNGPVQPHVEDTARGARSRTYLRCGLAAEAAVRSARTLSHVRRTPGISCEAVPAFNLAGAGMRRHVHAGNHAAESFVSFIPLFDGVAHST